MDEYHDQRLACPRKVRCEGIQQLRLDSGEVELRAVVVLAAGVHRPALRSAITNDRNHRIRLSCHVQRLCEPRGRIPCDGRALRGDDLRAIEVPGVAK